MLELHVVFQSCKTDNNNVKAASLDNSLANMSEQLCLKYRDFFDIDKAEQQSSHQSTDHIIELKSNIELLYMHIYNMFLTELKALDEYLIKALAKDWIQEFRSSADTSVLFTLRKSNKLQFCVDYCDLNVITVKNHYSLSLINELLNWLDDFVIFSKINLQNTYHWICICEDDE